MGALAVVLFVLGVVLLQLDTFEGEKSRSAVAPSADPEAQPPAASPSQPPTPERFAVPRDVDVFTLPHSTCYIEVNADEGRVREVPCQRPHDGEIYHRFPLVPPGATTSAFPGEERIEGEADAACRSEFATHVGTAAEHSSLAYLYWYPDEVDWGQGIREVLCVVVAPNEGGKLTFPARGSRR